MGFLWWRRSNSNKFGNANCQLIGRLTQDDCDRLDSLRQIGGFSDLTELMNEALHVLEWAIEQQGRGYRVTAVDRQGDVMDFLETIAR